MNRGFESGPGAPAPVLELPEPAPAPNLGLRNRLGEMGITIRRVSAVTALAGLGAVGAIAGIHIAPAEAAAGKPAKAAKKANVLPSLSHVVVTADVSNRKFDSHGDMLVRAQVQTHENGKLLLYWKDANGAYKFDTKAERDAAGCEMVRPDTYKDDAVYVGAKYDNSYVDANGKTHWIESTVTPYDAFCLDKNGRGNKKQGIRNGKLTHCNNEVRFRVKQNRPTVKLERKGSFIIKRFQDLRVNWSGIARAKGHAEGSAHAACVTPSGKASAEADISANVNASASARLSGRVVVRIRSAISGKERRSYIQRAANNAGLQRLERHNFTVKDEHGEKVSFKGKLEADAEGGLKGKVRVMCHEENTPGTTATTTVEKPGTTTIVEKPGTTTTIVVEKPGTTTVVTTTGPTTTVTVPTTTQETPKGPATPTVTGPVTGTNPQTPPESPSAGKDTPQESCGTGKHWDPNAPGIVKCVND